MPRISRFAYSYLFVVGNYWYHKNIMFTTFESFVVLMRQKIRFFLTLFFLVNSFCLCIMDNWFFPTLQTIMHLFKNKVPQNAQNFRICIQLAVCYIQLLILQKKICLLYLFELFVVEIKQKWRTLFPYFRF